MTETTDKTCTNELEYANQLYDSLSDNDKRLINAMMDMALILIRNVQQAQITNTQISV